MASSIETRLKRLEQNIRARRGCKASHRPNGAQRRRAGAVRRELAACPSCKGERIVKVFTREHMAEFRTLFAEQQRERMESITKG
jgi:hypothetical protein